MANASPTQDDLAVQYLQLWRQGPEPDVRKFLNQAGRSTAAQILAVFRIDQSERWRRGKPVPVETYLQWCPTLVQDQEKALELIYGEYLLREQLGQEPTLADYVRRFPQQGARLKQQVELHHALANVSDAATEAPAHDHLTEPRDKTQTPPAAVRRPKLAPPSVAGYTILGELGRGGMGVVYKAEQIKLKRVVALKMMLGGAVAGTPALERFRTEGESVARLQHPNIVQVYEVGEQNGLPFFSLEFCAGSSLAQRLDGTPLTAREAAALVETLARAMQAAHERGIVHRDLKPANVLFTDDRTPKIADFGLAKKLDDTAVLTQSGAIMGTPSYMAPEQAMGKSHEIGPPADIYALGAILYELLTGRPPFKASTPMETVLQVAMDEPVPPSRLQRKVPLDLETIALTCLEKAQGRRYPSALALAEDLRRFLAGEPVQARPAGWATRVWKWARRRPAAAALLFVSATALLTMLVGGLLFSLQLQEQRNTAIEEKARADVQRDRVEENQKTAVKERLRADQEKTRAEQGEADTRKELDRAQRSLFTAQVWRAAGVWDRDPLQALQLLNNPSTCPKELRDFSWGYYHRLCRRWHEAVLPGLTSIHALAISPNGEILAAGNGEGTVKLWDLTTRRERATYQHKEQVWSLAFNADGTLLASGSKDRSVKLWDVAAEKEIATLDGCTGQVRGVAFSPDGTLLATASGNYSKDPNAGDKRWNDGEVRLWDVAGHKLDRVLLPKQDSTVACLCFAPDGKTLACGFTHRSRVYLLDVTTGKKTGEFNEGAGWIHTVVYSPNGRSIAWGTSQNTIHVRDVGAAKSRLKLRGHQGEVHALAWSPDGATLVSGGSDKRVKVWDAATGQERLSLDKDAPAALVFTPDGKSLIAGGARITLWGLDPRGQGTTFTHPSGFVSVSLSADGKLLAGASRDKTVKVWDLATRKETASLALVNGLATCVSLSRDGATLAVAVRGYDDGKHASLDSGEWQLWDVAGKKRKAAVKGSAPTAICLLPDGKTLATGDLLGNVRLWDAEQQKEIVPLGRHPGAVKALTLTANGTVLASCAGADVRFWDLATRKESGTIKAPGPVNAFAFLDKEGNTLVTAGSDRKFLIWDVATGEQRKALPDLTVQVDSLAVSSEGQTIALGCHDRSVRLIDVTSGQLRAVLPGHSQEVAAVAFGPGDHFLVTASAAGGAWFAKGGEIKIWDAEH